MYRQCYGVSPFLRLYVVETELFWCLLLGISDGHLKLSETHFEPIIYDDYFKIYRLISL